MKSNKSTKCIQIRRIQISQNSQYDFAQKFPSSFSHIQNLNFQFIFSNFNSTRNNWSDWRRHLPSSSRDLQRGKCLFILMGQPETFILREIKRCHSADIDSGLCQSYEMNSVQSVGEYSSTQTVSER